VQPLGRLAAAAHPEEAGSPLRDRRRLRVEAQFDRARLERVDELGDPRDRPLGMMAEEDERHVQRLGPHRPQRRIAEPSFLPLRQAVADPVGQVEGGEQPRARRLWAFLGHAPQATASSGASSAPGVPRSSQPPDCRSSRFGRKAATGLGCRVWRWLRPCSFSLAAGCAVLAFAADSEGGTAWTATLLIIAFGCTVAGIRAIRQHLSRYR
jgi:hypothetical protein